MRHQRCTVRASAARVSSTNAEPLNSLHKVSDLQWKDHYRAKACSIADTGSQDAKTPACSVGTLPSFASTDGVAPVEMNRLLATNGSSSESSLRLPMVPIPKPHTVR